ncbi:MAG: V-type ATP synthase subunit E family protein [Spirochaetales bacterium]|nr:V-type ATP synthase subunit E family protein [Spirochaetales bacterium]
MKQSESSSELLNNILQTAEEEARTILETAGARAEETLDSAREKAARILNEAEQKARSHRKEVKKNSGSSLSLLQSRQELKNSQRLYSEVHSRVKQKLRELSESEDYKDILKDFILEGALGLCGDGAEEDFSVNGGSIERKLMTPSFLKDVEKEVQKLSGLDQGLKLSDAPPLPLQGIEITDAGGRRAFRNSFDARLSRYEDSVREIIDSRLQSVDTETPDAGADNTDPEEQS